MEAETESEARCGGLLHLPSYVYLALKNLLEVISFKLITKPLNQSH